MACDLAAIHTALADKVRNGIERASGFNVSPWPNSGMPLPRIEVWPGDPYVTYFETAGADGVADVQLELVVDVEAIDAETIFKQMTDFLSVGVGHPSSIADAVMRGAHDLGGLVDDCVVLSAQWDPAGDEPDQARIPVWVVLRKDGAEA